MRTSIATVALSGTLEEKLRAAAEAGFDAVELFEDDLIASPLSPERIRSLARELGLGIELYQPFRDVEALPPELFERGLRRARHTFQLMNRLGATTLLVCSNCSAEAMDDDANSTPGGSSPPPTTPPSASVSTASTPSPAGATPAPSGASPARRSSSSSSPTPLG